MTDTSEFSTDQVFKSREDLTTWVQNIARSQGYVVVTKRSKAVTIGFISKITLGCDRGGLAKSKDAETKKINCPFELVAKYLKAREGWMLRVVRDEHNHEPSLYMEGHPFAMRFSDKESHMVQEMTDLSVKPRDILLTLKEQNENNVSSLRTIYNFRHKYGRSQREGRTPMQNVMHILQSKGYDFEYRLNKNTNELENLFFMHPTSLRMWQAFPYVVLMDSTYQTNKYNLPFLEIVGVTSTNKTFSIAFAFMHNEKTSNYKWALTLLKLTINDSFFPRVIVTDRDLALMKACGDVFPQSKHLLCRWHIFRDITNHCKKRIKSQKTWDSLHPTWKKLVESPTQSSWMQNYADLQTLLIKHPDVFGYLYTVWLEKYAERFVSLWTDRHLNFGNSTTNRVESQHAKLKKHLESRKCDLDKFIRAIEKVVRSQDTAIKESFTRCKIVRKPKFKDPIFQLLRCFVSEHAMDQILEELHRSKGFVPTPENCGCQLRSRFGLPCAHEIAMYVGAGLPIPLDSVDAFWRKLDLEPSIFVEYGDLNVDRDMQRFKDIFNKQSDHDKYLYLRRLRGITDPSEILINEPAVKKNNRGRPKVKRAQHQSQAPHRYSCSDLNQDPPRHSSSFMDLNDEPARHSSFLMGSNEEQIGRCSYKIDLNEEPISQYSYQIEEPIGKYSYKIDLNEEPISQYSYQIEEPIGQCSYKIDLNEQPTLGDSYLLEEIPSVFHPYVTCIKNVRGDGNCGFRSVAVCLGYSEDLWLEVRQQLLVELLDSYNDYARVFLACDEIINSLDFSGTNGTSEEHWMVMPETGILIANRFGVILTFLTDCGPITFFPLWKGPEDFPCHKMITIALVHTNHYVMVKLEEGHPMPPISALWVRHKAAPAIRWETMYRARLEFYKQIKPTQRSFMCLDD